MYNTWCTEVIFSIIVNWFRSTCCCKTNPYHWHNKHYLSWSLLFKILNVLREIIYSFHTWLIIHWAWSMALDDYQTSKAERHRMLNTSFKAMEKINQVSLVLTSHLIENEDTRLILSATIWDISVSCSDTLLFTGHDKIINLVSLAL